MATEKPFHHCITQTRLRNAHATRKAYGKALCPMIEKESRTCDRPMFVRCLVVVSCYSHSLAGHQIVDMSIDEQRAKLVAEYG
jgi:hypothetical protein